MRKMLLVSIVLLVAAQAFAGTVTMSVSKKAGTGSERWASIGYSADANVSGFGLKIYTADPNAKAKFKAIADYNVGECNAVKQGYGIFPGGIDINENTGVVNDWNTPIAPSWDPCAAGTGLDTNTIIAELGALYVEGNQPPLSGTLFSVKVDGDCNVCVTGEPLRGNVVLQDANGAIMSPTTVCAAIAGPPIYYDFGDANDSYPTLKLSGGPYHTMAGPTTGIGSILGANIDAEADGQPSANCLLDDTTGPTAYPPGDEDGITGLTAVVGSPGSVTVTVSAACKLNAWIDFNNDGDFADAGEQIFTNQALNAGPNVLAFAIPGGAVRNIPLVSRWRVNDLGGPTLSYTGPASDGEVEDYNKPTVVCPALPGQAADPNPAAGAKCVPIAQVLSWTATGATSYDVYFGTTSPPTQFMGNQGPNSWDPCGAGNMPVYTKYYWRIDTLNACGQKTTGTVWCFTTGAQAGKACCSNETYPCIGDVNGTGPNYRPPGSNRTDSGDLSALVSFLSHFGSPYRCNTAVGSLTCPPCYDVDGSGRTDSGDISALTTMLTKFGSPYRRNCPHPTCP